MADTLLAPFERIGRAVMDLGFGGFLEKFEDHFGRGWTKAFLVLIGAAVVTICASTVWALFLHPVAVFLAETLTEPERGSHPRLWKLVFFGAYFLILVNALVLTANTYFKNQDRRQLKADIIEARALNTEGKEYLQQAQEMSGQAKEYLAAADLALEQVLSTAVDNDWITPEQATELRALAEEQSPKDGLASPPLLSDPL
jgi:hypothetical protein